MLNPPRAPSPLHVESFPSWAHALFAVVLLVVVAYLASLCWAWMAGPAARHACGRCDKIACGFCQREERDRVASNYARQAREGRDARSALKESLSEKGGSRG